MIGFTQYSPAVLSLLVDRDQFYPLVVHNASENTYIKISDFLGNSDGRIKIIMIASMDILKDILEKFDLHDVKIIVLDTILNLSRADLEIQDAQQRPNGSFQFFPITPADLNKALGDCEFGLPEGGIRPVENIPRKAQIIRKNIEPSAATGELSDLVNNALSNIGLGKREESIVVEGIMKYIAGIFNKRQFRSLCNTYGLQDTYVETLTNFVKEGKGKSLRIAFMDVLTYNTSIQEAVEAAKANRLDFDFLISVLPEDKKYEFAIEIPSKLVKKRRTTIENIKPESFEPSKNVEFGEKDKISGIEKPSIESKENEQST